MVKRRSHPSAEDITRTSSDADEERALGVLLEALSRVEQWEARVESLRVLPHTSLAGDDRATAYDPLSSQVRTSLAVAIDNMRTLKVVVVDGNVMPAMSVFALLRSAIEAIGVGLWLLGPTDRDVRVLRSLQLTLEARMDVLTLAKEISGDEIAAEDDPVRARLVELRTARPGLTGRSLNAPTITKRLASVREFTPDEPYPLLLMWRVASGVTHGRRASMFEVLERRHLSSDELGFQVTMTASFSVIAAFYVTAERDLSHLIGLFDARNRPTRG